MAITAPTSCVSYVYSNLVKIVRSRILKMKYNIQWDPKV